METEAKSVTVVIAAYRAAATIRRAIDTALAQPEVERVIVIDDCSPDDTVAVARGGDDGSGRLVVLEQPVNRGPAAARNRALDMLETAWFTVLDSDDWMMPGRIGGLLRHAGEAEIIADDIHQIAVGDPAPPTETLMGPGFTRPAPISLTEFIRANITRGGTQRKELGFIKPLIHASLIRQKGLRYDESLRLGEDFDIYCRMMATGARLLLVPAQGYVAVVRPDSLSGRHTRADLLQLRDADDRLASLPGLTDADRQALREHYLSIDCRLQWLNLIEAVKSRDVGAAVRTFLRPFPVPKFLTERLIEQAVLRTRARFRPRAWMPGPKA
jgi:succinoglycan biosynthesis protein ExoU